MDGNMRKLIFIMLIALAITAGGVAVAEVSTEDMARVRNQLLLGNPHNAIELLHNMQVEAPDSPFVQFGLGEAYAKAAEQAVDTGDLPTAVGYLESARRAFDAAAHPDAPPSLNANAHYNAANTMTRMGELMAAGEQYQGAVQQLQGALETYDTALAREPDHPGARHNRAYTRWALKQLLMEEPPPEEEPQPQPPPEGDEEQEDEGEDEQDQPQPQPEDEEGPEQQPEPEATDEQPEGEEGEDELGEAPQPPSPQEQDTSQPLEPEDMPMQDFEALLDNLMDIDDEEQANLRREQRSQHAIGEWW